jgi:nucleoporin NUP82
VPSLAVYESIDLGLLPELKNAPGHSGSIESRYTVLVNDPPAILRDPFDNTTFFVHHALGVHRISLAPWINGLTAALNADEPEKLDEFWSSGIKSENTWAVDTLGQNSVTPSRAVTATVVITDVRIGTTLISMAASRNVVALDLVVPTTTEDPLMSRTTTDEKPSKPAYVSLLGQQPYTIRPEDFDQVLSNLQIRSLIPTGRADQPLQTISSEDLRAFGNITQKFAAAIKEIRSLSSQVEGRLDLQVQEVARQLKRVQEVIAHTRAVQGKQDRLVRQILPDVDASDNLGYIQQRCKQLVEKQQAMTERLGIAMQNMMDNAHPEISLQEKAWMEDLNEMQREIEGEEGNDKSLKARVSSVSVASNRCTEHADVAAIHRSKRNWKT